MMSEQHEQTFVLSVFVVYGMSLCPVALLASRSCDWTVACNIYSAIYEKQNVKRLNINTDISYHK